MSVRYGKPPGIENRPTKTWDRHVLDAQPGHYTGGRSRTAAAMKDRAAPSRGQQYDSSGKMDRMRGAAAESNRGGASGHFRTNTAPTLAQFRDAVESVLQCKAMLAESPPSSCIRPSLVTAQRECKSAFLKLVRATDDADDVVRAAAYYVRNATQVNRARVIRHGEKYRKCAKKRLVEEDQDMLPRGDKNGTMKFVMCHQRTYSELFSITATRPLALDLQVLVWQILDLATLEKTSRQRRQTKEEDAAGAAGAKPASSSAAAADAPGLRSSLELTLAKMEHEMPEKAEGNSRKRNGRNLGEQERAFRSPSSPGADGPFNNDSRMRLEIRGITRSNTVHHGSSAGNAQGDRFKLGVGPPDGGQSRQTDGKRRRMGVAASSPSHRPSHSLVQAGQPCARATSSAVDNAQLPSSATMVTDRGTAAPVVALAETTASSSRTPYTNQRPLGPERTLRPNLSDKSPATTTTRQATREPAFGPHGPPQPPQAGAQASRRSIVQESSPEKGRSVQVKPKQVGPHSRGHPASAVEIGNGERRREPDLQANAERIAGLFHNLRDDERVEAEISLSEGPFESVKKRLGSKKSWSQADADWVIKYTRVFSGGYKRRDVHASINPMSAHHDAASCKMQYARPSFGASCRDVSSVIFRRVHERQVQGPTYYTRGEVKWEQRRQIRRFFYESGNSSFVFQLVKMWEGESWEKASESKTKYYVFVQSQKSAQARRHPVHSGRSLVAKVFDILRACGEQKKSLTIQEIPYAAHSGGGTDD